MASLLREAVAAQLAQLTTVSNVPLVAEVVCAAEKKRDRNDGRRDQRKPAHVIRVKLCCAGRCAKANEWVKRSMPSSMSTLEVCKQISEIILEKHGAHHSAAVAEAYIEHNQDGSAAACRRCSSWPVQSSCRV